MDMPTQNDPMSEVQKELESMNLAEAAKKFWERMEGRLDDTEKEAGVKSRKHQMASMAAPGARFIREKVGRIVKRIEKEWEAIQAGKGGTGSSNIISFLYASSLEAVVYLALKEVVDRGCRNIKSKESELFRYDLIINAIGRNVALELATRKEKIGASSPSAVVELEKAIKREGNAVKKKKLQRQRNNLLNRLVEVDFTDDLHMAKIGQVLYKMMLDEKILVEGERAGKKKTVRLADDVLELLAENLDKFAEQKPFWGPLVMPPRPWTKNWDGGYHYDLKDKHTLLKRARYDFCEEKVPEVFSAVNTLQGTAFHINQKVLDAATHIFSTDRTDETREKLFGISQTLPLDVRTWLLVSIRRIMDDANRIRNYPKIFFTCFLDFRGRYYCKATHLNPQGSDLCRGLVEFAEAKPIRDERAERWLINHGVCCFGNDLDRGTFADRVKWAKEKANIDKIRALARDPISDKNRDFLKSADKPWAFLAWCHEWAGFCEKGYGYESRLPVAVDGSCNGIQHFAALMRSRELAEQVNLARMKHPGDIYKVVAERTERRLRERRKAMTWYSSLTLDEISKKYNDYSWQLHQLSEIRKEERQFGFTQQAGEVRKSIEPVADVGEDEPDDLAMRSAEEDFDETGDEPKKTKDDEDTVKKPENMELKFVMNNQWDTLSPNKRMECLQECRRQLAECMLMAEIPDSAPDTVKAIAFNRKLVKSIVMTFPYSATHNGNVKGIVERLSDNAYQPYLAYLAPQGIYQLDHVLAHAIVRNTRAVIRETVKDAILIMAYLKNLLPDDPKKTEISWFTPTGLRVNQHYANQDADNMTTLEYSGMSIKLYRFGAGKTANYRKHKQGISPNFVHSCDAAHMMKTVNAAKAAGINSFLTIHDSYATHAADMENLSRILREEFVKMYTEDNPDHPLKKLRQALPPTEKQGTKKKPREKVELTIGDFDINEVLGSDYFFS